MPLSCMLEQMTHREFLLWKEYLKDSWNNPNRTDHYLMKVITKLDDLRQVQYKNPKFSEMEDHKIHFYFSKEKVKSESEIEKENEEKAARSRAIWKGIAGIKSK